MEVSTLAAGLLLPLVAGVAILLAAPRELRSLELPISHPFSNLVGVATLTEENAHAVIAQVKDFYGRRGHTVGWWVNPSSTPRDLVSRLAAAGFARILEQAGQVLTNPGN